MPKGLMPPKAAEPSMKKFTLNGGDVMISNKVSDARGNPFSYGFSLSEIAKNLKDEWVL